MTRRLEAALVALHALIDEDGWEFPDATARICRVYDVDLDDLRDAYDAHCVIEREPNHEPAAYPD